MYLTKAKRYFLLTCILVFFSAINIKANETFLWPLENYKLISSYYGKRQQPIAGASTFHKGIDISAPRKTKILAIKSGYFVPMGYHSGNGNWGVIDHGDGVYSAYLHMDSFELKNETYVERGQVIGYVGSTGISTGPHLHLEIRNGTLSRPKEFFLFEPVDPLTFIFENKDSIIQKNSNHFDTPKRTMLNTSPMMRGNDIKWLQKALSDFGFPIIIDGYFGNDTMNALINAQSKFGLEANGICDTTVVEMFLNLYKNEEDVDSIQEDDKDETEITSLSIENPRYNIVVGKSKDLNVSYGDDKIEDNNSLTWKSSNEEIAYVEDGKVTIKSKGMAVIICEFEDKPQINSAAIIYSKPKRTILTGANVKDLIVNLKWKKDKTADGYEIFMSDKKDGSYKRIKTIKDPNTIKFSKKNLQVDKAYYFKIRAYYLIDDVKINSTCSVIKKLTVR